MNIPDTLLVCPGGMSPWFWTRPVRCSTGGALSNSIPQDGKVTDELQHNNQLSSIESLLRLRARRRRSNLGCIVWSGQCQLLDLDSMSAWIAQVAKQTGAELGARGPLALQSYTHPVDNTRYVVTYSEEQHDK